MSHPASNGWPVSQQQVTPAVLRAPPEAPMGRIRFDTSMDLATAVTRSLGESSPFLYSPGAPLSKSLISSVPNVDVL